MILRILLALALVASLSLTATIVTAQGGNKPDIGNGDNGGSKEGDSENGDGDGEDPEGEKDNGGGGGLFDGPMLPIMIGVMVLMLWMSSRGKKKQANKQKQLLDSLAKGDKVRTIGGILGSVVEVRKDEVVIRIDDNSNTRMRIVRRAIAQKIVDDLKDDEEA